ncbi:MAG: biotin/lipoyl-binding protein, partial [Halieaceae bacterium]
MAITPLKQKAGDQGRSSVAAVLAAVGITTVLTAALYIRVSLGENHDNRDAMPVSVTQFVITDSYSRDLPFLGLIRARRSTDVGFEVPGQLAELLVTEGSVVGAGEVLGHLDTSQLTARRSAAAANLQRVRSELELAKLKSQRQKDLSVTGAVSEEAYDETRLTAQALTAQLAAVTAELDGIDIQ